MPELKLLSYQRHFIKKDFFSGNSHEVSAKKYGVSPTRIRQVLIEEFGRTQYDNLIRIRSKQREKIRKELQLMKYRSDKIYRKKIILKSKQRYERIHSKGNITK